jgi:sarcosine oxidase subunit beta
VEQELLLAVPTDRAPRASISNAVDAVYERPELTQDAGPGRSAVLVGTGFPKRYPAGDPDAYPDQAALPELVDELRERLAIRQPALASGEVLEAKLGLYDITPDWHPLLGRVASVDGLLLITGGSGHGFKIAPAMAELVAADACGERVDFAEIATFALDRFERGEATFASAYGGNRA